MSKCFVSGCPNWKVNLAFLARRRPKRFFSFPKDPARVKVWLAALREMDRCDLTDKYLICEDHFLSEDICNDGIVANAIPIMPPYLDGPMGLISPWGVESSEEEQQTGAENCSEGDVSDEAASAQNLKQQAQRGSLKTRSSHQEDKKTKLMKIPRKDLSLRLLTRRFLELMLEAPGCSVDVGHVATKLKTQRRRIYNVTNALYGISVIEKESTSRVRWIGQYPISTFLFKKSWVQKELETLKRVESTLDSLIKSCAQQLFDMTDDVKNSALAYVNHTDVSRLQALQGQTVIAIKAPEETKLEIPAPTEDSILVHLKASQGPITVLTCDLGSGEVTETNGCFATLEESRIRTKMQQTVC